MKSGDSSYKQNRNSLEDAYREDIDRFLKLLSYIILCTSPALGYFIINARTQRWTSNHSFGSAATLILLLVGPIVLLRMAKSFLLELYKPVTNSSLSQIILRRLIGKPVFPFLKKIFKHTWVIIENGELKDSNDRWVTWLGGPALLIIIDGSAAYLERGMRFSRVVGSDVVFLHRDEIIKHTVNLHPQEKEGIISAWTKDGIKVAGPIYLKCQIGTAKNQHPNDKRILAFNPTAVRQAIESTVVFFDEKKNMLKERRWLGVAWYKLPGKISSYIGSHDIDELLREDPEPGKTIRAYVEQRLKTELNKELAKNGITVLDLKIDKNKKIEVDPIVEKVLTEHWAAEKESLLIIEEGRAKAGELRYRLEKELAATEAFEEAISEGLESINPEHFSQLLSLMSRELATNIVDPIARAQLTQTILKEYNKIRDENTLL